MSVSGTSAARTGTGTNKTFECVSAASLFSLAGILISFDFIPNCRTTGACRRFLLGAVHICGNCGKFFNAFYNVTVRGRIEMETWRNKYSNCEACCRVGVQLRSYFHSFSGCDLV